MRERPILFSGPMVRAILNGSKSQTRRALRPQPSSVIERLFIWKDNATADDELVKLCPYGRPGDRLWVRESHWFFKDEHDPVTGYFPPKPDVSDVIYRADGEVPGKFWRPSIHMPRWACRIVLEVTEVRVQRLQDISEADAVAEGCEARKPDTWWQGYTELNGDLAHIQTTGVEPPPHMIEPKRMKPRPSDGQTAVQAYRLLWASINGMESWDANPWVWAVTFKPVKP